MVVPLDYNEAEKFLLSSYTVIAQCIAHTFIEMLVKNKPIALPVI